MLIKKRFGASGGAVSRISSSNECCRKYTVRVNITPMPRLARIAVACAPGRYRFDMPWRKAADRLTIERPESRRTIRSSNAPDAARTSKLAMRTPAKTLAYLIDEPTQIAIAQSPAKMAAPARILRRSRGGLDSSETSLRSIHAGFTSEIESNDGKANSIA